MKRAMAMAMGMIVALGAAGCKTDEYGHLDVRTFQLEYINPDAAHQIIDPYVFADRGGMTSVDAQTRTITVRETPEMLARIEEVLDRYDQPAPSVRLHFRIVEANGGTTTDPALAEIEEALPTDVFRYSGYRQVGEAVVTGIEWSEITQRVVAAGSSFLTTGSTFWISGRIGEVRVAEDSGTLQLRIELSHSNIGPVFQTEVNARIGQLLILGSADVLAESGGALILAVEPELVRP